MPSARVAKYWNQLYSACRKEKIAAMDSLGDVGSGDDSLLSFKNRIVLTLYLGKYEKLNNWLSATATPMSPDPVAFCIALPLNAFGNTFIWSCSIWHKAGSK